MANRRPRWLPEADGAVLAGGSATISTPNGQTTVITQTSAKAVINWNSFSIGAGVGLLYNRSRLDAPYIIQTQPQLAGAKTLLDMEREDYSDSTTQLQSKQLMRFLLAHHLGGAPLNTRQILIDLMQL